MSQLVLEEINPTLVEIAKTVCSKEQIDFNSLDIRQKRGLICYWCSSCHKTYPLTDLITTRRRKICGHCRDTIKIYTNSNKYGKVRRMIFNRILEASPATVQTAAADNVYAGGVDKTEMHNNLHAIKEICKTVTTEMEKLVSMLKEHSQNPVYMAPYEAIVHDVATLRKLIQ